MKNFNDIAGNIAKDTVQYAMQSGITLDYTRESADAVLFGTYIGEMMLRSGLAQKGFVWVEDDGLPILSIPGSQTTVSPITKAHKRILNGAEDSMKSFVNVVILCREW